GLVFASMRSSEEASVTTGISVVRAKMIVFAVSAFIAGLGGALYGSTLGSVNNRSFTVTIGIVWLAIVVTWGVRSVIGALLAGMLFAIAPLKLAMIVILTLVLLTGGLFTRFLLAKAYRKPSGAALMALCAIVGIAGSYRLWTKTSDETAVHIILVSLALVIGVLAALRVLRLENIEKPVKISLAAGGPPLAVAAAIFFRPLNPSETTGKEWHT